MTVLMAWLVSAAGPERDHLAAAIGALALDDGGRVYAVCHAEQSGPEELGAPAWGPRLTRPSRSGQRLR